MLLALENIWDMIVKTTNYQTAELWTWEPDEHGNFRLVSYGSKLSHLTKANPVQTWCIAGILYREAVRAEVEAYLNQLNGHTVAAPYQRQAQAN